MRQEQIHSSYRLERPESSSETAIDFDLVGVARFFYNNRSKLGVYFCLLVLIGGSGLLVWQSSRPTKVQGRVVLSFKGIEKGEYPDGRKFSIEKLRSPDIISMALVDAQIAKDRATASGMAPSVDISPVLPKNIAVRWAKQDKEGVPREEYFPNEFTVTFALAEIPRDAGLRFFEALMKRYRERETAEWMAVPRIVGGGSQSNYYGNLLQDRNYDYGDVLRILITSSDPLTATLSQILSHDSDPSLQISLKDTQNDLAVWSSVHLETLKAMTYGAGLVKNKDIVAARFRYRLSDCNILIRQKTEEITEAFKLLSAIQKAQPMLVGQLGKESQPTSDSSMLDRLVGSNYLSPLVKRISDLQHEVKVLEAEKMRLERDQAAISPARNVSPDQLSAGYRDAVKAASQDLEKIITRYNSATSQYLTVAVANAITVKEGPVIVRDGPTTNLLFALLVLISALLAIVWVRLKTLLRATSDAK